jgi:CheY-like chemotaxis protein
MLMNKLKNILLVDDDSINNFIVINKLNSLALVENIISLENGEEAILYIKDCILNNKEKLPEIILLDINMPIMDGWGFLDEFEKIEKSIRDTMHIYMVSSSVYEDDIEKSKEYPVVISFISKPLSKEKLNEIIRARMQSA